MRHLLSVFLVLGTCAASFGAGTSQVTNHPSPTFKARIFPATVSVPFRITTVVDTSVIQNSQVGITNKTPDQVVDPRKLLENRTVTAVVLGSHPMVMIDGETFELGDELLFPTASGEVQPPGANVRLTLKKILVDPKLGKDGVLLIEMVKTETSKADPVEFEFKLPSDLNKLLQP